jgi:hypothetical protein
MRGPWNNSGGRVFDSYIYIVCIYILYITYVLYIYIYIYIYSCQTPGIYIYCKLSRLVAFVDIV